MHAQKSTSSASTSASGSSSGSNLGIRASGRFPEWLDAVGVSLVFTTYQTNRLFFVGRTPEGRLAGFERLFDRPMGLHATPERLTMATRYQIRELVNVLPEGDRYEGYDRVYVPRRTHVTGTLDAHDVHRTTSGDVCFVNTRYSCLAAPSETHSFRPVWTPPFISRLLPEDRCHLNGLATGADGRPRYVTAVSRSDVAAGWRDRRTDGGVVVDVETGDVIADGLSMPHSPRLHRGTLYVVNAGTGELGTVDRETGRFEPVAFCPGYGRGLAFHGDYALVGLSKPRRSRSFQGLALSDRLEAKDVDAKCGLYVIELSTGRAAHWMAFTSVIEEIYDVQVLPGVRRPMALGFKTDEIQRFITMETDDGPVRHLVHLDDLDHAPATSDGASGSGSSDATGDAWGAASDPASEEATPADAPLASVELPTASTRGVRRSGSDGYACRAVQVTAGEILKQLDPLVPDRFRRRVQSGAVAPGTPLTTVLARQGTTLVGFAAADTSTHPRHGVVHAVSVLPDHRGQGLGTTMLRHLEDAARQADAVQMHARYRSSLPSTAALERLFEKRAWNAPEVVRRLYRGRRDLVTPAFREALPDPPSAGTVFRWEALSETERRDLQARLRRGDGTIPDALNPFQMADRVESASSVGVRHEGRVAGWMVTHRVADAVLQFTCLYVDPSLRGSGAGPGLLGEAIRRYLDRTTIPRCVWMVDADKPVVQRFVERRLAPVIDAQSDEMHVSTTL